MQADRLCELFAASALVVGCSGGVGGDSGGFAGLGEGSSGELSDDGEGDETEDGAALDGTDGEGNELDDFIFELGHLDIDDFVPKTETACAGTCPADGQEGEEFCNYVHYDETRHSHELVAFQPNSATLWPGAVVQGEDAEQGLLTPIGLPRAPITFSVSLENLNGSPVGKMKKPSLSAFREARNEILSGGTSGATPAQLSYSLERVYEASQVAVAVGGSLGWAGVADLSSQYAFSDTEVATKLLVNFTQAYYTWDVDPPGFPSDLFSNKVRVEDVENYMGEENPPMYVQSITYGRRVFFAVESQYSEHDVRFAFDASFDAFFVSGGVEVDTYYQTVLDQSRISAFVLGGSGAAAVKTVTGFDGLLQYIEEGADYSKDSPGAPIAYKLAYLDNSGVQLSFTTDYSERHCYDSHVDVTGEIARIEKIGGNEGGTIEVFGYVGYRTAPAGEADPCNIQKPGWQWVFNRDDDSAQDVHGLWIPAHPLRVSLYDIEVDPDAQLCLYGRLREADNCWLFCSDDDFGSAGLGPIPLDSGWAGDHVMEFAEDGTVQAVVRISVD